MSNDKVCLTIPGALEWDGDNGTHGVVGTHSADGAYSESAAAIATLKALGYTHNGGTHWKPAVGQKPDFDLIDSLRAQLAERDVLLRDIELTMDGQPDSVSLGYDVECRMAAILRPAGHAKPAKPKTCIECDQPYCHGVCVERGDHDYDRDQAAKGGDDE